LIVFDGQPGRIFKPPVFIHIPATADTERQQGWELLPRHAKHVAADVLVAAN
jgi:hypothetical protein